MRTIEVTGKTLDEAKMNALLELKASSDQVSFEVIDEGSKGLLGLLRRSAKVRATLQEEEDDLLTVKEPVKETPQREPVRERPTREPKKEQTAAPKAPKAETPKETAKQEAKPASKNAVKGTVKEAKTQTKETAKTNAKAASAEAKEKEDDHLNDEIRTFDAIEAVTVTGEKVMIDDTIEQRLKKANENKKKQVTTQKNDRRPERQERPERPARSERASKPAETAKEAADDAAAFEPKVYEIPKDSEEVINECRTFLTQLLHQMGIDTTLSCQFSQEGILEVNIEGEGMGVIIGKRGQTLDALQYLTTLVINKGRQDHVRLKLDTEGYRLRRQETLEKLAVNLAKKAKRTGHRVVLEPMNPYERRIIHSVLQQDRSVETHSDGEEPYRKVVITPKRRH